MIRSSDSLDFKNDFFYQLTWYNEPIFNPQKSADLGQDYHCECDPD